MKNVNHAIDTIPPIENSGDGGLSNFSGNPSLSDILNGGMSQRRILLKGGLGFAPTAFMAGCSTEKLDTFTPLVAIEPPQPQSAGPCLLGFNSIAISRADTVEVPEGYTATPFMPWGTPIHANGPAFLPDEDNSGMEQEQRVGSHHDGMHFFPIDLKTGGQNSGEGLLVMNHEYIDPNLLHANGPTLQHSAKFGPLTKSIKKWRRMA